MNCTEIKENFTLAAEMIEQQERDKLKLFIAIMILAISLVLQSFYIIYDRKKDSEVEYTVTEITTSTEIVQDGNGYNAYLDGIGDINIGAENQKNKNN